MITIFSFVSALFFGVMSCYYRGMINTYPKSKRSMIEVKILLGIFLTFMALLVFVLSFVKG